MTLNTLLLEYASTVSPQVSPVNRLSLHDRKRQSFGINDDCNFHSLGYFPSEMTVVEGEEEAWKRKKHIKERVSNCTPPAARPLLPLVCYHADA